MIERLRAAFAAAQDSTPALATQAAATPAVPSPPEPAAAKTATHPGAPPPAARKHPGAPPSPVGKPKHPPRRGGPRRFAALIAGALVLAAGLLAVVLLPGEDEDKPRDRANGKQAAAKQDAASPPAAVGQTEPASQPVEGSAAQPASASPEEAVQSFYERAASDDFEGAWALATPRLQSELGGFEAFSSQQSTLESIEFPSIETTSEAGSGAVVSFQTIAKHTGFIDRCSGTMSLVGAEGSWSLDDAQGIDCQRSAN